MERPATWKVVTVGAAMTGLAIVGAGSAAAATASEPIVAPIGIEASVDFVALGDDWTETYWDDGWTNTGWGNDWTETDD